MLGSRVEARLVGHSERPYEAFKADDGKTVPSGVTHTVTLADPSTGAFGTYKVNGDLAAKLRVAWWGGLVTVEVVTFNNARLPSITQVIEVGEGLLSLEPAAPAARK